MLDRGFLMFLLCVAFDAGFRERLLARIAGFSERDEREELVTAKAARAVYLVTLAGFLAAGLFSMVRFNVFAYTRWAGAATSTECSTVRVSLGIGVSLRSCRDRRRR